MPSVVQVDFSPLNQAALIHPNSKTLSLPDIIGKGYKQFFNFKGRYNVCKGGRASKKSCTAAIRIIYNMMRYPLANTMVVRQYFNTHRDSTFAQLKWATQRLQVPHLWTFKEAKLEAIYNPTGQKIIFRGMDDPLSITSITVEHGFLCWVWIEEAFQVFDEEAFNRIDMSVRGAMPPGYFKQFMLTFNPWNEKHWIKKRFFDPYEQALQTNDHNTLTDILAITTTHRTNEWLDDADRKVFDTMSPQRRTVEENGDWGITEGAIYTPFIEGEKDTYIHYDHNHKCFYIPSQLNHTPTPVYIDYINIGIDWGGRQSNHAFCASAITKNFEYLIILDSEVHIAKDTTPEDVMDYFTIFYTRILKQYGKIDDVYADSAEQLLINLLRRKTETQSFAIRNSLKRPVIDRIRFTNEMLAQRRLFLIPDTTVPTQTFFKSAVYDAKSLADKRLDDGSYDNDSGDAYEYSVERYINYMIKDLPTD